MLWNADRFNRRPPKDGDNQHYYGNDGMTSVALTTVLRTPHRNMPNIILADGCRQRPISTRLEPALLSTKRSLRRRPTWWWTAGVI